jgi:hypothetical protein
MAGRTRRRNGEQERFWREVVKGHAGSDLSVRQYCAERRVSEASFFAWRREMARRDAAANGSAKVSQQRPRTQATRQRPTPLRFANLQITPSELTSGVWIEIALPTGTRVRVPRGVCPATLQDVLTALERPSC